MTIESLIGFIREPNTCYPEPPEGVDVRASDLDVFLESVEYLSLDQVHSAYGENFWPKLIAARKDAASELKSDLIAFLSSRFVAQPGFSGQVGAKTCTQYVATEARLRLITRPIKGASLRIAQLGMLVDQPLSGQTITLTREGASVPLFTMSADFGARSYYEKPVSPNWLLPCDGSVYLVESVLPPGVRAGDNLVNCGCGSNMNALAGYAYTNATTAQPSLTGRAGGFILTVQTACSTEPLIDLLLSDSRVNLVVAWMLAYKTAYRLQIQPFTGGVERTTVLSADGLKENLAQCDQAYLNRLAWLRSNCPALDVVGTCLTIPRVMGWSRGGINTGY